MPNLIEKNDNGQSDNSRAVFDMIVAGVEAGGGKPVQGGLSTDRPGYFFLCFSVEDAEYWLEGGPNGPRSKEEPVTDKVGADQ